MYAWARRWHLLTFLVTLAGIILQLVLVVQDGQPLPEETDPAPVAGPALGERLINFASYFTILSNALVCVTAATLAADPVRDGRVWRALRLTGLVAILCSGVVRALFLPPQVDPSIADRTADTLLHIIVPLLAAIGWLLFGPRNRIEGRDIAGFLIIPVIWLSYTLVRGAAVHWYPYPFLDVDAIGYPRTVVNVLAVAALLVTMAIGARLLDPVLPGPR